MSDTRTYGTMEPEGAAPAYFPDSNTANIERGQKPPTYTELQNEAPPPSYEALFGEIRAAQRHSDGNRGTFVKSVCSILINTVGFTILIVISLAVPVLMIVVGSLNLGNCPVERFIPIWLIVGGAAAALMQIFSLGKRMKKSCCKKENTENEEDDNNDDGGKTYHCFNGIFGCFNIAWFFAGNVWVYRVNFPDTINSSDDDYCDYTTYYLSFWLLTIVYICIIFLCCCSCCVAMGASASSSSKDNS